MLMGPGWNSTIESGSCVAGGSVAGLGNRTINLAFKPTAAG
jgi:hypothetical protein